jgi:hypothetical protein
MQKVKLYDSPTLAEREMEEYISKGWRVHTCCMTSNASGLLIRYNVLVVYEK